MENNTAKIWVEDIVIPTYRTAPPEKYPLFIEKRAYQGSTGKVYPLPVTEKIFDQKEDVSYTAVFLENEYLKVMILPQLGGRIQRAYDKTNGYDFVYYNEVIKPALVGLTGPWISGGIEFNWPQHHRPTTFSPVDYAIHENEDGSVTVHLSETDCMYGTKGMASISLYPGKAYIEIHGRLFNPTDLPQTFLWWANPAVSVNDHTFSVFPPDVNAVMDHGKRAVSTFPIATGEYYKCDYSEGVDISRYSNVPVPTSFMAAHSDYDFIGNYDEQKQAGLLHVADHHISPGKKQWTWGNSDFGRSWDRNLTDENGPYIELMTGVFADNQPDFTWLKPHEEKTFTQYFMPYKGVGRVCNATKNAALGMEPAGEGKAALRVYVTAPRSVRLTVTRKGQTLLDTSCVLSPAAAYEAVFDAPDGLEDCCAQVLDSGMLLAEYQYYVPSLRPIPEPEQTLPEPEALKSTEELYLAAQHLEQYRHATYEPADYYLEGLRRDPTDIRLNDGYGLLLYRRGNIQESIPYFREAIRKQTWKTPNPYSGESYFHLGLALQTVGEEAEAFDAFYKSTWSAETQSAGFFWLACLSARRRKWEQAVDFADHSLAVNYHNMKTRTLKAALLRHMGKDPRSLLEESLAIDPLYPGCVYEKALLEGNMDAWHALAVRSADTCLSVSEDYLQAGLAQDALRILNTCEDTGVMGHFYKGYAWCLAGDLQQAKKAYTLAEEEGTKNGVKGCSPNRLLEITILRSAIDHLSEAPAAHYCLGCLLYDKKQYENAIRHWEAAVTEAPSLAAAHRSLAIAYYNKRQDLDKAFAHMRKACDLEPDYPRFWLEYDQLCARANVPVDERLRVMEEHLPVVQERDDLYLRYITLQNCTGHHEEALKCLSSRRFHPWEGGEGKVSGQYVFSLTQLAVNCLQDDRPEKALEYLQHALSYPDNLGEGKLPNAADNRIHYYMGQAYHLLGQEEKARQYLELAASGGQVPAPVLYYNDQPSDYIFYQGLACRALGREKDSLRSFHQLIIYGEKHLFDKVSYDYFAVSLPEIEVFQEDIALRNTQYCTYLRALGAIGTGETVKAEHLLREVLSRQADHQGAICGMMLLTSTTPAK